MFLKNRLKSALCGGACALAMASGAMAQTRDFNVPAGDLQAALDTYAKQAEVQLLYRVDLVKGASSRGAQGALGSDDALALVLAGTGLEVKRHASGAVAIVQAGEGGSGPQSASAGGDVDALIVTAQKREENIQDVPIAISAFTQEDLTNRQVAGGPDLITQVPNMTFTKTNFSSYSIQLRGIGTQAISATTDAAVAVAFNNTSFIRNKFFEQEFYDLERVEVLRGPQGTLYGRNATAGVVNIISAKPSFREESKLSVDVGNYDNIRLEGMVNIPIAEDNAALRIAGAWTKREGYVDNEITGRPIDGRDLWSTRVSLRFEPTDRISANLVWEHFEEDDDRLRSGKQLCNKHVITEVAGMPVGYLDTLPNFSGNNSAGNVQTALSQGCLPASLYAEESFQTPNGSSLPYYVPLFAVSLPAALSDPYQSTVQSRDLRVIESAIDPEYRASSDIVEIQLGFELTDTLSLTSETAFASDSVYALQDLNRFNTAPGAWNQTALRPGLLQQGPDGGVFCDPQLGCSDRLLGVDLSTADSRQFSQEFRLSSDFDGPFNFAVGTNFLRYDTEDKYYVFINSLSLISAVWGGYNAYVTNNIPYVPNVSDNSECLLGGPLPGDPRGVYGVVECVYVDPNPLDSVNDQGHNYFLSKNPYKLISYAAFGEAYYQLSDNLKITAGLRLTRDAKEAPRVPSWLLAGQTAGYPVAEVVRQEWTEPTGRLAIDWKPDLAFTDETLLYASYAHGYKAGGANPPNYTYVFYGTPEETQMGANDSATRPRTFAPEFIDAFEVGAKNTLFDGTLTLNLGGFFYDYEGYQISEIVDRSAFNRNFDATVWGLELEADWRPADNLRLGLKLGYEKTRLADGSKAIDLMDRTAGEGGWIVVRPLPTFASNCVLPEFLFEGEINGVTTPVNLGGAAGGFIGGCELAYILGHDPVTDAPYVDLANNPGPITEGFHSSLSWHPGYEGWDPATAPNNGEGFFKDLSGNELPNAPEMTATVTVDYTLPLPRDWLMTLHGDLYYQSEAWTRVFNTDGYDKLKAYTNVNLAAIFTNEESGWNVMAYVKNVFDRDSITGAFLNSDDLGLTTNVFLTEPRRFGLRVSRNFVGLPLGGRFDGGEREPGPYQLTLEMGGQVQRHDAPYAALRPGFASQFPAAMDIFGASQNRDLDKGAGREFKLTARPGGGPWSASVGARFGRTSGGSERYASRETDPVCAFGGFLTIFCDPNNPSYNERYANFSATDWAVERTRNREEHQLIDFAIGHDVGFGGLSRSTVSFGLRHASFKSTTNVTTDSSPDHVIPAGFFDLGLTATHTRHVSDTTARREFDGWGPVVEWDAALRLLGDEDTGRLDLDWAVGAGVMFGRQDAAITGAETESNYERVGQYVRFASPPIVPAVTRPIDLRRGQDVEVPAFSASLGLSYSVDRVSLRAGYRWERYFDAVDGGADARKTFDRTIDGPYFKVAIGFGG